MPTGPVFDRPMTVLLAASILGLLPIGTTAPVVGADEGGAWPFASMVPGSFVTLPAAPAPPRPGSADARGDEPGPRGSRPCDIPGRRA